NSRTWAWSGTGNDPCKDRAVPTLSRAARSIASAAKTASRSRTRIPRPASAFKRFVTRSGANAFSIAAFRSPNSRSFSTLMTPCSNFTVTTRNTKFQTHRQTLERETGIEPATNSLEGCDSTTELLPLSLEPSRSLARIARDFGSGLPLRSRPQNASSYSRSASNLLDPSPESLGISAAGSRFAHARKTPQVTPAQPQRLKPLHL